MKYLPIDYSGHETSVHWLLAIAIIVGLFTFGFGLRESKKNGKPGAAIGTGIAGAVLIGFAVYVNFMPTNPTSIGAVGARLKQAPEIQKIIENTYGLKPTASEVRSLDYPTVKPTKDFEVFGSFKDRKQVQGTQFEQRTIYLVWADGKFGLSQSSDGESFKPLKAQS